MKKNITIIMEYETNEEFEAIREMAKDQKSIAWSMENEILRVDLMRQAISSSQACSNAEERAKFEAFILHEQIDCPQSGGMSIDEFTGDYEDPRLSVGWRCWKVTE